MSNIVQNLGEGPPSIEITMDATLDVAKQFIPYQPVRPLKVMVQKHHRDDPSDEFIAEFIGEVVSAAFDSEAEQVTFICRMTSSNFSRRVPWMIYQRQCNYGVYTAGCGVNKEDFETVGIIDSVIDSTISASEFGAHPDGWFRAGFVQNERTDEIRFIIGHTGAALLLQTPFVDLLVGDTVYAYAGDDRSYATCHNKFANGHRFLGFEWMPEKNPFTDNVYGSGTPAGPSSSETDWNQATNPAGWNGTWGLWG
jgi:uncharacterized phage protein (TIGR02218 family)